MNTKGFIKKDIPALAFLTIGAAASCCDIDVVAGLGGAVAARLLDAVSNGRWEGDRCRAGGQGMQVR